MLTSQPEWDRQDVRFSRERRHEDMANFFYDPLRSEGYYWLRTSINEISKISETIQSFDVIVRIS